jgi:hypothetical protein
MVAARESSKRKKSNERAIRLDGKDSVTFGLKNKEFVRPAFFGEGNIVPITFGHVGQPHND